MIGHCRHCAADRRCYATQRQRGELRVTNLSEQYQEMKDDLAAALMDGHQQKLATREKKRSGG